MADQNVVLEILGGTADLKNLQNVDLSDADLRKAKLHGANLQGADLRDTDLRGVELGPADLRGADMRDVDLRAAKLQEADLQEARLGTSNFQGADLSGANLKGTNMTDANLQDACLAGANLQGTKLKWVNLMRVDLRGAQLQGACLNQANMQWAKFDDAEVDEETQVTLPSGYEALNGKVVRSSDSEKQRKREERHEEFMHRVCAQITWWESTKPSQPDADWQEHYAFLLQARKTLSDLRKQAGQLKS